MSGSRVPRHAPPSRRLPVSLQRGLRARALARWLLPVLLAGTGRPLASQAVAPAPGAARRVAGDTSGPAAPPVGRSMWTVAPAGHPLQVNAERRFDATSGLRGSTVFAMQLDRSGIPWLAAEDGLYFYAGGTWRREPLPAPFANQQIRSLLLQTIGDRWVGTRRGLLHRPREGDWRTFGVADGLPGPVVFSLIESRAIDGKPRVVAGTSRGVAYFDGTRFVPLPLPAGMDPVGMMLAESQAPDGKPELWAASARGGLARLHAGRWTLFGASEGLATPDVEFVLPADRAPGSVVYAAGTAGVFALVRAATRDRFVRLPDSPRDVIRLEVVTTAGESPELWAGRTDGQLLRWHDGRWSPLPSGISERHGAITLLKAIPGHGGGTAVYASARSGYLIRLSRGVAGGLMPPEVQVASYVSALHVEAGADGRDAVWVGTVDRGVLHVTSGARVERLTFGGQTRGFTALRLRRLSLAPPTRGPVATARSVGDMVAVADSAPWRLRGTRFERFDAGLGRARVSDLARVMLPDGRDALLAGTTDGVRIWTGARWEPLWPGVTGVVSTIAGARSGGEPAVYLGGRHEVRVVRLAGSTRERVVPAHATGVGAGVVRRICTLDAAGRGRVFALDTDLGVLWRDAGGTAWSPLPAHFTRVQSTLGVTDIACRPGGYLALSTFAGVALFDVTAATADGWRVVTQISDADGLPANAVTTMAQSGVAPEIAWVGTTFGVGVMDLSRAARLPPAKLTVRVTSEANRRPVEDGDALRPGDNDVRVDPMLLTFHREELTRFRVRLTGTAEWPAPAADVRNDSAEGEWLDAASRNYNDLAPGSYELAVWAYDWAGREYGPVQRRFSVLTPTWRTWPARIVYVLSGILLLSVAYRWRVRTIRESTLQLLDSERRALDSEGRFRAIFDQALDGHLLFEDGRVQAVNAQATRLFGVAAPEELQGRTLRALLGPDAEAPGASASGESVLDTAHGTVPVHFTITAVPSADRVLRHAVVRDLTAVRKAEAERAWFQAQVREAQKLESLGTLAGGVAHDFNNLLGVIRGNAELARTALKRGRSNDDNLGAILDASDRARDIVRQILTFSRRSTPTREYVNLSRIVLDLQPLLRRMIPRTVQLVIEGAEASHLIMGDPTQLQQLLLNLVSNAEYAMRSKTDGVLTIALSLRKSAEPGAGARDCVVLQVRDTGAGMSEEVRSRIFEPFFTTKPTGEGTGLGMAVVHGIVVSHEGRAEVISEPGQGTTFEIRFPQAVIEGLWDEDLDPTALIDEEGDAREAGAEDDGPAADPMPARVEAAELDVLEDSPFAGTTIVVVDDEPAVAHVVERALQHYGHVVHVFPHPELALQFIRQQPSAVDLLITDQTMPGMTGDLLAESVHALRSELPVLILTGFSHRLTPERIAAAGAHAVLLKPVELAELKRRVDAALLSAQRR